MLLRELLAHADAYDIVAFTERREAPRPFALDWSYA
jgi:hypothetical protein